MLPSPNVSAKDLTKKPKLRKSVVIKSLVIDVATTWIAIPADVSGNLPTGQNIAQFIQSNLVQRDYNPRLGIWQATYNYTAYDKNNEKALLPRHVLPELLAFLGEESNITINTVAPIKPREIKISLKPSVSLRDNQIEPVKFLASSKSFLPLSAQTGQGKYLPNGTLIKVPGSWKAIGELQLGDTITAPDGGTTQVCGVYPQGEQELYSLDFEDGRSILAGKEHLWSIYVGSHQSGKY